MAGIAADQPRVTVGIDTHGDIHVAAVLDELGRLLGTDSFRATGQGHRGLEAWAKRFRPIQAVGIEGTGAWGAGITRHLTAAGHSVIEVRPHRCRSSRPCRARWHRHGHPQGPNGRIEAIRALRVARRSAIKARSQAAHQLHCLVSTATDELRDQLRTLRLADLVKAASRFRPGDTTDPTQATKAPQGLSTDVCLADDAVGGRAPDAYRVVSAGRWGRGRSWPGRPAMLATRGRRTS